MPRAAVAASCAVLCLVLADTAAAQASRSPGAPPLVLISVDALGADYLRRPDHYGLRIPQLRRLLAEGAHASGVRGVLPTVTYPSHTTLVTGVSPARHGIVYNEPFDPLEQNQGGWYWYAEDIQVPTLWDAAEQAGLGVASVDWPVSVGARIRWNIVQFWRTDVPDAPDDHKLTRLLSTPGLLDAAELELGRYPSGYAFDIEADRRRAAFSEWILEHHRPQLHLAYFAALDEEAHSTGPGSPRAIEALEQVDALIGRLREAAARGADGPVIVAVVSDHAQLRTTRELRLNEALRAAGLISLDGRGRPTAWKAKCWGSGGSAAIVLADPGDAATRQSVARLLERIAALPDSPIERILDGAEALEAGGFPGAAFVVGAQPDVRIETRMEGPLVGPALPQGEHGHLPDATGMDASFVIAGPGVPVGRDLGRIDMRDIAPTLAVLLGVPLPDAEGRNLFARDGR